MTKRSFTDVLSEARRRKRIEQQKVRTDQRLNLFPISELESQIADVMAQELQKAVDEEIVETIHDKMIEDAVNEALRPV